MIATLGLGCGALVGALAMIGQLEVAAAVLGGGLGSLGMLVRRSRRGAGGGGCAAGPSPAPGLAAPSRAAEEDRDELTGLPGKSAIRRRTAAALRNNAAGARTALLAFDLDRLKDVNACWGYAAGDEVLRKCAERLMDLAGTDGVAGRLGGDRFALVLPGLADSAAARRAARSALELLGRPLEVGGVEIAPSATIGVALYPDHGSGFDQLMRCAELAVDEAKREGGGRLVLFDPRMDATLKARKTLERELRRALETGQFAVHFQPQFDLATGAVVACEALIRWRHPERGYVPPVEFVPVAESNGLIRPIGAWILREALAAARRWLEFGCPVRVAVNVSAAQLRQRDLPQLVRRALAESRVPPDLLELEVTESLFVDPSQITIRRCLDEVAAMGVSLAIDDFGTGYSSLACLKRLPVDRIKIDKSFLREVDRDPVDVAIVRTIIGLARTFDLRVVAEGVESEQQRRLLEREGCDEAQGYHFAKPMPEAEVTAFMAERLVRPPEPPRRLARAS
ncbi:MAG: bifunctional diguanylate cyclase/phosphodiesterase [Geminicoccaceae bacterium]|nr:bifunctional diguanylate cyclase/phosphodiesterase [Geminicoccaceae bacterium]MCX8101296.1 bifunctional diguanylate cyclase/phosphodiesterase [Geminicoccaceae bacterium]MDW8368678.1 bifunctional diguanylate cyclase/phosphodiesterase [Geminicoccaceae bacterium]